MFEINLTSAKEEENKKLEIRNQELSEEKSQLENRAKALSQKITVSFETITYSNKCVTNGKYYDLCSF